MKKRYIGSLDAIVTRDYEDFAGASLPILSVTELLEQLKETGE